MRVIVLLPSFRLVWQLHARQRRCYRTLLWGGQTVYEVVTVRIAIHRHVRYTCVHSTVRLQWCRQDTVWPVHGQRSPVDSSTVRWLTPHALAAAYSTIDLTLLMWRFGEHLLPALWWCKGVLVEYVVMKIYFNIRKGAEKKKQKAQLTQWVIMYRLSRIMTYNSIDLCTFTSAKAILLNGIHSWFRYMMNFTKNLFSFSRYFWKRVFPWLSLV